MTHAALAQWTGPHGGFPRFDQIRPDELGPALHEGMAAYRRDLAAITANTGPPGFVNTILALEIMGLAAFESLVVGE